MTTVYLAGGFRSGWQSVVIASNPTTSAGKCAFRFLNPADHVIEKRMVLND